MSNTNWDLVASVVITGLIVVFLSLIILVVAVSIIGKIFSTIDKRKLSPKTNVQSTVDVNESTKKDSTKLVLDVLPEDDSIEVISAITAAIAVVMESEGNNKPFVIKSVKRVSGVRNVWNQAGLIENTQPL